MNINFPYGKDLQNDNIHISGSHGNVSRMTKMTSEYSLDISVGDKDISSFGMEELKSFDDVKKKASVKDVSLENNALAVMSNSMSGEDFAKLSKDGFSVEDMTPEETVTNLDKIKANLALSGTYIPGYTDDISDAALKRIAGSEGYAAAIETALAENQLPVTRENAEDIADVLKQSEKVSEPSDDAKKYMLNNDLEPTVSNLYMANHSSSEKNSGGKVGYYKDAAGYIGKNPVDADIDELKPQIEKIIIDSGLELNNKTFTDAKWLIEKNLPLTEDNLKSLQDINSIRFPLDVDTVARSSAAAIADGKSAKDGVLTETESVVTKAVNFVNTVSDEIDARLGSLKGSSAEEISAKRMLEETRLHLTLESSIGLMKKGIDIDTSDLKLLVEQLKQSEKEAFATELMDERYEDVPADRIKIYEDELEVKLSLFRQTSKAIESLASAPVDFVGKIATESFEGNNQTLSKIANVAENLKSEFDRAGKAYETMMTAPRADLGDSIRKAFRNVDDILDEMNVEVNRLNEKAVRILGYAGIEITDENIEKAVKAEVAVENLITNMTPGKVLKMIRDGENPLDKDIYELSKEITVSDDDKDALRYSEFLYKLDKSGEITEDEKSAFIGMYRLFRKIEKSDGRLVGNVIKADEKLTLSNIISASRTNRKLGTDIKIDDSFGALEKLVTYGESITDQILKGFKTKDLDEKYAADEAKSVKEMLTKEEAVLNALENVNEATTPINMAAMDSLINTRGSLFKGLKNKLESDEENDSFENEVKILQESFDDEETVEKAYKEFAEKTEDIIKNKSENADKYIDVKSLKLLNKQLGIVSKMSNDRTYEVPAYINGELTSINLKIISDSDNSGKVKVSFETDNTGRVSSEFTLRNGEVSGFIATENSYFESVAKNSEGIIKDELKNSGVDVSSIYYSSSKSLSIKGNYTDITDSDTPATKELYAVAKALIKAVQR